MEISCSSIENVLFHFSVLFTYPNKSICPKGFKDTPQEVKYVEVPRVLKVKVHNSDKTLWLNKPLTHDPIESKREFTV